MTGPLRLLMLAACVVGGISLAVCLTVVSGPDLSGIAEIATNKVIDSAANREVVQDAPLDRDVAARDSAARSTAAVEKPAASPTEIAYSDAAAPSDAVRQLDSAKIPRMKPVAMQEAQALYPGPIFQTPFATTADFTTPEHSQESPKEVAASAIVRFKGNESGDAASQPEAFAADAAPVAKSPEDDEQQQPTKHGTSPVAKEPAPIRALPYLDKAIARPLMIQSAGSRANDGQNHGRVVQVQYQAPLYIAPPPPVVPPVVATPAVAPQVKAKGTAQKTAPRNLPPQPAFGQQIDPNAPPTAAAPQSSANSVQLPPSQQSSSPDLLPGSASNAGTPPTGDGISSGTQPSPSLNGPWAAGGIQPGSAQPGTALPQNNSPPFGGGGPAGPGPSEEEPEAASEPEPRPSAGLPAPRAPRAEIKAGEGDRNLTIHIQDTDLREVLDLLSDQGGLNILASNNVEGRVSASLTNVDVDTALAAILKSTGYTVRREGKFIYVGTPKDFQGMTQAGDRLASRVYRLNYVKAADFQALIVPLLTPNGVGMMSVTPPGQIGIAADVNNTNGDLYGGNETVLVRDYEGVLAQIDQVHEEIDVRPMQVAIEAMILSVELDDKNSFGVNFQFLRNEQNIAMAAGSPPANLGQVSFANGGLQFGFLDSSLGSFINALETIGDTNVIATPRLTCLNKHRAEILIGTQQGYVNSTSQNLTSTTQAVAFLETGTQLRLRPFISNDGMIRMEVHPESSTGTVTLVGGFTLPNKDVTEVTTNVMVPDGRTVIIGGLMREELDKTSNQLPLLGSLPGIGWLFRNKTETIARHELIVLITPHIVYEPCASKEGEQAACDFHRRQAVYQDQMSPINTRYLGRKYFRLAQTAWAAGDGRAALRFVNLSIHFDPQSRAAIDLRSDIMAGNHEGPHSGGAALAGNPADLDGKEVPPWLLDNLEPGAGPPKSVIHPLETGQPGRTRNIVRPGGMQ